MAVDSVHPLYADNIVKWERMRDSYGGEDAIKARRGTYLAPTSSMRDDGFGKVNTKGEKSYLAYLQRAVYPDIVEEAVHAIIGIMHRKPAIFDLPESMRYLEERASAQGEALQLVLRKINHEQLVSGRVGILGDVIDTGERRGQAYLSTYFAEHCLNWDEGERDSEEIDNLRFVALDESEPEIQADFSWRQVAKYRVLVLGDPTMPDSGERAYATGVFRGDDGLDFSMAKVVVPQMNGVPLTQIPFSFANRGDIVPTPDAPPLLGLANLALAIYRGEADYRNSLFLQGQDTLVVIGAVEEEGELRVGAGARIKLPVGGDAKYIGVNADGLSEQREALAADYERARAKGGQLLDTASGEKESGEALRIRVAARTTTLIHIAQAGAAALQRVLRAMAPWHSASPESVVVTPHTDFVGASLEGRPLVEVMSAKVMGFPLSLRSLHALASERGVTEMTFEDELAEIDAEKDLELGQQEEESGSTSDGQEDDEDGDGDDDDGDDE